MLRIYKDNFVPKYKCGKWTWDAQSEQFKFITKEHGKVEPDSVLPAPYQLSCIKFKMSIDQVEELIIRKKFRRPSHNFDADVITIQDIKNLVLFLAPSDILTNTFIDFIHTITVDKFFNALIIYFEYFLKIVEFLLIRRDETNEQYAKIQGLPSVEIKKMLSEYLSQYRLLVAREYSKIMMGTHDVKEYHHITPLVNISQTIKDRAFHEAFIAFTTQVVWIAMHRRAYRTIDNEINRLFRSGHFNMTEIGTKPSDYIQFSKIEQQVLYGKNDKRANFRVQNSPIVQEIINVSLQNLPILWIGEKKYRGTDKRIYELEMEFVVPDSQMAYIDISHGILGHPQKFYNTMLALDWTVIRLMNYTLDFDPYKLVRSPYINLPKWDTFKEKHVSLDAYFEVRDIRYKDKSVLKQKNIWRKRDKIIAEIKKDIIANDIILSCQQEIEAMQEDRVVIDREKIIKTFLTEQVKLRKK